MLVPAILSIFHGTLIMSWLDCDDSLWGRPLTAPVKQPLTRPVKQPLITPVKNKPPLEGWVGKRSSLKRVQLPTPPAKQTSSPLTPEPTKVKPTVKPERCKVTPNTKPEPSKVKPKAKPGPSEVKPAVIGG